MNYKEFIHPEDEAAMRNLEAVPGFDAVARFILEHYTEDLMHGLYMAQNVRLSPATSARIAAQNCDRCNPSGEPEVVADTPGIQDKGVLKQEERKKKWLFYLRSSVLSCAVSLSCGASG